MVNMQYFELNTGSKIPVVGLGTWKSAPGEVGAAVKAALEAGYRHIDCAAIYGNEPEVGEALEDCMKRGVIKREDLWITSKLWPTHFLPEDVEPALKKTLKDLRIDYLDLWLTHIPVRLRKDAPMPTKREDRREWDMVPTWREMERLHKAGLIRNIGVSNFTIPKLERLLPQCEVKPAVNQVEAHPVWRQDKLYSYLKDQGIHMTAYSPLGSSDRPKAEGAPEVPSVLKLELVEELAKKMNKSTGQILIRWAIQRGTSVLPKSVKHERIKQNLDVLDWELSEEDFNKLSNLEPQIRILDMAGIWVGSGNAIETPEEMWDNDLGVKSAKTSDIKVAVYQTAQRAGA